MSKSAVVSGGATEGQKKKDTPRTPLPISSFSNFSTEEIMARVDLNDKLSNILRSPRTPSTTARSIYNINSARRGSDESKKTPRYTVSHGILAAAAAGTNLAAKHASAMLAKAEMAPITATIRGPMSHRQMTIPTDSINFDVTPTARSAVVQRALTARYPVETRPLSSRYAYDTNVMRRAIPQGTISQLPKPMPPPPYALQRLGVLPRACDFELPVQGNSNSSTNVSCMVPLCMNNGIIQVRLRDGIRIDMTIDKSVRVFNQRSMVSVALSRTASNSAMIHPNGRILQSGSKVELVTYDGMKTNSFVRFAKMWYKGVSFTSENCPLIYLVDTAGTRTTTDTFTDLTQDYTMSVLYDDCRHGPAFMRECRDLIEESTYTCTDEGCEVYDINGYRITQAADGLVKVTRANNKCLVRTSPANGSATITTPNIHCTASLGKTSHLFVRRNEKRMHFDGSSFIVRNAGHSSGFNENNLLIVY